MITKYLYQLDTIHLHLIFSEIISVLMQHCPCTRDIEVPLGSYSTSLSTDGLPYSLNNTTCSSDAFLRGSGQKVVSFSFFGDLEANVNKKRGYLRGTSENLKLMRTFYPGWTMRLYLDLNDTTAKKVDWCYCYLYCMVWLLLILKFRILVIWHAVIPSWTCAMSAIFLVLLWWMLPK